MNKQMKQCMLIIIKKDITRIHAFYWSYLMKPELTPKWGKKN